MSAGGPPPTVGDAGFLDEAGYLHLTGRLDETINRGGEKIAPDEVDCALNGHPAVAEAAALTRSWSEAQR